MKPEILEAAITVARRHGYLNTTRQMLADELGKNLNWIHNNCKLTELIEHLRVNAELLGLEPGDRGASNSGPGRHWAEEDKRRMFEAAWDIADAQGLGKCTREAIALRAEVAPSSINRIWGNVRDLRAAVVKHAHEVKHEKIIAQGDALGIIAA